MPLGGLVLRNFWARVGEEEISLPPQISPSRPHLQRVDKKTQSRTVLLNCYNHHAFIASPLDPPIGIRIDFAR